MQPLPDEPTSSPPEIQNDKQANLPNDNATKTKARRVSFPIFLLIITFVGIIVGASWILLSLFPISLLKESDLTSASTTSTRFEVPKHWARIQTGGASATYGNDIGNNQSSGMISVIYGEEAAQAMNFSTASDSFKAAQRDEYFKDVDKWIEGIATCDDKKVVAKEKDTTTIDGISGLFYFELSCVSPGGKSYTLMNRIMLGDDGHVRTVTITALDYDLKLNRGIYNKMLKSITQSES